MATLTLHRSHLAEMDQLHDELADPEALTALFNQALKHFQDSTLGSDNHNPDDFLPTRPLHLTLFRFGDRSILAASPA